MKATKSTLDSFNENTSSTELDVDEYEIEKGFLEIESFNKAVRNLKDLFLEKLKSEASDKLNKTKSK